MRQQQFVGSTRGAETRHLLSREILVQIDVLVMASFEHRVIITDALLHRRISGCDMSNLLLWASVCHGKLRL